MLSASVGRNLLAVLLASSAWLNLGDALPFDYYGMFIEQMLVEQMAEMTHTSTSTPMTSSTTTTTLPTTTTTAEGVVTSKEKAEGPNWKIAHFNGDSRVVVEPLDGSLDYLELVIQFKSNKPSGVLFSWQSGRKFLVVALENFFMKVYVSLGADVVVLSSENAVSLYRWHKVEIWRSGKGILLKVNRQSWVEAELHSEADDEKTAASMAVGGFEGRLPRAISDQLPGFSGCLKRPRLNGRSLSLGGWGATNVSECLSDPCSAAGCPQTCASVNNEPVCMCEWPHSGDRCQQEAGDEITAMSFGGVSYLELAAEKVMNHVTGNELKLSVDVKLRNFTTHLSQVILSAGDSSLMENDFVELAVDGGRYVRFSMNLGSGVVVLTHPRRLLDERWTTIEVIRKDRHVTLSVNGEDPISSTSPEGAQQLNVYHSLFIGGRPPATAQSSQYPSTTGLHGCVLTVRLADDVIAHPKQATRAVNVADCSV